MLSNKSKEYFEWNKDLSGRIIEAEKKEIEDRKSPTDSLYDFVLQNFNRDNWRMKEGVMTPSKTPISPPNKQILVPFMEGKQ